MVALALWLFVRFSGDGPQPISISYTQLLSFAEGGQIDEAEFRERDQQVIAIHTNGDTYVAEYPLESQDELDTTLRQADVEVRVDPQKGSTFVGVLVNLLPILLLLGIFLFIFHQGQGGGGSRVMAFSKSKARQVTKDTP